jgi:hypothetical protein
MENFSRSILRLTLSEPAFLNNLMAQDEREKVFLMILATHSESRRTKITLGIFFMK